MPVSTFRDLIRVCEALGLQAKKIRSGILYTGTANGKFCTVAIHKHAKGRDIPTGTFLRYVKDLGFKNADEYISFIKKL